MDQSVGKDLRRQDIGRRLAEERLRLNKSQQDMADAINTSRRSVISWEGGEAMPGADSLALLADQGVDVLYVVTSRRAVPSTGEDSQALTGYLRLGRQAREAVAKVIDALNSGEPERERASPRDSASRTSVTTIHGSVGQKIDGDVVNHGPINVGGGRVRRSK